MESFPLFFRIRAVAFTIVLLFSFLWFVLLSVEVFARWTVSDQINRSLMILFILTNTITLVLLPILILVKFRVWLDAARLLLLFVLQVGSAIAATYWSPKVHCPDQTLDDIGVCNLIGVYTMIACWIIPAILVLYSIYFAVVAHLQSRIPVVVPKHGADSEMGSAGSPTSWREIMKEIVGAQATDTDTNVQPRPLVLPTTSLSRSLTSQPPLTLPDVPRRQSTLPSSSQHRASAPHTVPSRHRSLPAFKHQEAYTHRVLMPPIPHHLSINVPSSLPQTPSSYSYSTPSASSQKQTFDSGLGYGDVRLPSESRWQSKHLSMMPSPGEMHGTEENPADRSKRGRLSKPLPPHLM